VLDAQAMKRALDLVETVHHLARRQGAYAASKNNDGGNGRLRRVLNLESLLQQNGINVRRRRRRRRRDRARGRNERGAPPPTPATAHPRRVLRRAPARRFERALAPAC
jgi:hypothetical protein